MALSYYHRAEKIQPENLSVQMNIGHCYVEQKDYEEALKYYFKVDYLDPEGGKAWRPIAWCSFLVGKKEQAVYRYEDRALFDIVKTEVKFPFVSALAFRYLCKYEDRMRLGIAKLEM